jgi:hypothetical protein
VLLGTGCQPRNKSESIDCVQEFNAIDASENREFLMKARIPDQYFEALFEKIAPVGLGKPRICRSGDQSRGRWPFRIRYSTRQFRKSLIAIPMAFVRSEDATCTRHVNKAEVKSSRIASTLPPMARLLESGRKAVSAF